MKFPRGKKKITAYWKWHGKIKIIYFLIVHKNFSLKTFLINKYTRSDSFFGDFLKTF